MIIEWNRAFTMRKLCIDMDDIDGNEIIVKGQDAKHLANVMRFSPGMNIDLCDGKGRNFKAEIRTISSDYVLLDIVEEFSLSSESPAYIVFGQGMLKDKKMDIIIRHLTELGVSEWIPFFATRSIPKPKPKRLGLRMERWKKIAKEALNQCGRSIVPHIRKPVNFSEFLCLYGNDADYNIRNHKIIFWENASRPIDELRDDVKFNDGCGESGKDCNNGKIIVLIGPEGGFTEDEINLAYEKGFKAYSLGPRILRAETASIASCSLIQNIFGDLGRKSA